MSADRQAGDAQAHFALGLAAHVGGDLGAALAHYSRALERDDAHADAWNNRGLAFSALGRADEAAHCLRRAVSLRPGDAATWNNLGNVLSAAARHADALSAFDRAADLDPDSATAHFNRGVCLEGLGRHDEALAAYARALAIEPSRADARVNRANLLRAGGQREAALADYRRVLAADPGHARAWYNLGLASFEAKAHARARECFDRAAALDPAFVEAHANAGTARLALGEPADALACFERALRLRPGDVLGRVNAAEALERLGRHADARDALAAALSADPAWPHLRGAWLQSRLRLADWDGVNDAIGRLSEAIARGEPACMPIHALAVLDDRVAQRRVAESWVARHAPARHDPGLPPFAAPGPKIRLGYFSPDFRDHVVMHLVEGLFARHDRRRFEVIAFASGPVAPPDVARRIASGFDAFVDVRGLDDRELARVARDRGIDIAIDLAGHTEGGRLGAFAFRAAPVQASYLGYPGASGAPYVDYLVADGVVVPHGHEDGYGEALARLPGCFLANGSRLAIAEPPARQDEGLPATGAVLACFNALHKLTPATFARWLRVLEAVPGSVLWLRDDGGAAAANLRARAREMGVDPARLVFARREPSMSRHLSRLRLADLFLDTAPYNAHTTGSDALWAGVPVLTLTGESFVSRVATSMVRAAGLPELAREADESWVKSAVEIASDADRRQDLRTRLAQAKDGSGLFDIAGLARRLEDAYEAMHARRVDGLPPAPIG